MPRFEFKEENVKKNLYDFPKLKLKKNEVARIVLLEDPVGEYVHNLRKPKLVNGIPETEVKERRDGTTYEAYKTDWVSSVICLGDFGTLEANGSDADRCPVCAEAAKSDIVLRPQRRFAMHVIQYQTKPNGDVATPFGVTTKIWAFTDKVFGQLFDIKKEWKDLRVHDLILKCTNEAFQNYEITVGASAAWRASDENQRLTVATFKENRAEKIEVFCGSPKEAKYVEMDLAQVREAWAVINGSSSVSEADAALSNVGTNLAAGLDDLLGSSTSTDAEGWHKEEAKPEAVGSFDDLLGGGDTETVEDSLAASVATSAPEEEAAPAAESADELDDLLAGL